MKRCLQCNAIVNDTDQICNRCGSTKFVAVHTNNQQRQNANLNRPQNSMNRPNNGMNRPQRPNNSMNRPNNGQQRQNSGMNRPNNSQQRQNVNMNGQQRQYSGQQRQNVNQPRPNMNMNEQTQNTYQHSNNSNQNTFVENEAVQPTKKLSRKERKALEMKMMQEMQEAQQRGEIVDVNEFRERYGLNDTKSKNKTESTINSGSTSLVKWLVLFIIMTIPLVNVVFGVIGIKSGKNDESTENFFKAFLIYYIVALIISIGIASILWA